ARTGAKEPPRVWTDHFTGEQVHVEFVHRRFGRDVEVAQMPQQPRWSFRRDRDRFVATSLGDVVEVRNEPFVALAGSHPDGVGIEAEFIASGDRRPKL